MESNGDVGGGVFFPFLSFPFHSLCFIFHRLHDSAIFMAEASVQPFTYTWIVMVVLKFEFFIYVLFEIKFEGMEVPSFKWVTKEMHILLAIHKML